MRTAPVVSFKSELNGASTAGWSVTVSGLNFGGLDATPTSTIGLSHCRTATWASSTSLVCKLASGDGVLVVGTATVSGIAGTRTATFSYDGLFLSSLFNVILSHMLSFFCRKTEDGCIWSN